MDIAKIINQRYPMRLFLPDIRQKKGITLSFSAGIGPDFRSKLASMVNTMNIDLSLKDYQGQRVSIELSRDEADDSIGMTARENGAEKRFRIEQDDPVPAAAWTLYALATCRDWFSAQNNTVAAKMFSLDQQILARSIIDAVNIHRSADMPPQQRKKLEKMMREKVEVLADDFSVSAPSLRYMAVPESGWNGIRKKWLKQMRCRELLCLLDCDPAEIEEMDGYCRLVRENNNYREKIATAVFHLMKSVRYDPMVSIEDAIKSVRNNLSQEYAELDENAAYDLREALNTKCSPRVLNAGQFGTIFKQFDDQVRALATAKLRVMILRDLTDALLERYYALFRRASKTFRDLETRDICYIKSSGITPQKLDWQELDENSPDLFQIESRKWQDDGGSKLADIVQNGYPIGVGFVPHWLCGAGAFPTLENLAGIGCGMVEGLNDQLLVVYMVKGG